MLGEVFAPAIRFGGQKNLIIPTLSNSIMGGKTPSVLLLLQRETNEEANPGSVSIMYDTFSETESRNLMSKKLKTPLNYL